MQKPESFYEIEMKALLSEEQYKALCRELPIKLKLLNKETIYTTKYMKADGSGDVRLRHSDKTIEVVCKDGDPTMICRREVRIPLESRDTLDYLAEIFVLRFRAAPPWTKHKKEFEYNFNGFNYIVCLQHIENFAYIMEVEYLSKKDEGRRHKPNLERIIRKLGCEPIEPREFLIRINEYIKRNKKIKAESLRS